MTNEELAGVDELVEALRAENARLRDFVEDAAGYTGEGPFTTPWRDIVRGLSRRARAALKQGEAAILRAERNKP